jgi:hypothetical protein
MPEGARGGSAILMHARFALLQYVSTFVMLGAAAAAMFCKSSAWLGLRLYNLTI